ncbi:conserved hypothetical protein [Burkholderia sp. 8Y]|uniref:hypothetical protein n=1 Tax=Burkholderia sp. 8Y TaxID=2653133 RepID=UPI0012F0DF89|nr:hypothetical protein [Burkholderia sp. 8Y]VXB69222.1 conserved hypothetical protein [Burkholderia sp. 8Y]
MTPMTLRGARITIAANDEAIVCGLHVQRGPSLRKETLDFISAVIGHLAWPTLILILALLFYRTLLDMLARVKSIKHGETELTFARQSKRKLAGELTPAEKAQIQRDQIISKNEHYTLYANGTFVQRISATSLPGKTSKLIFPIAFPNEATAVQVIGDVSARFIGLTSTGCTIAYSSDSAQCMIEIVVTGV